MKHKDKLLDFAELIDAYRVVPRAIVIFYGFMLYQSTVWFMALNDPNTSQSAFIGILWGAASIMFKFYVETGRSWPSTNKKTLRGPQTLLEGAKPKTIKYGG